MQLDNVKTLRDAVNYGKQFLEDFGIENAQYDATELLLEHNILLIQWIR